MAEADARNPEPSRPSPEALLEVARAEGRGQLKVFLGMAPGVGKTYEMLQEARRRHAQGQDVVVGVVETHGRAETQALLEGLEIVPRRQVPYRGRVLEEMDLDALLQRRPQVALVDELAHTNAPGSRHPKRYQDVEELLAAGVDVLTTVNVQHLESLNDVVARITRAQVRETVPDRVVDEAAEIELVDITPAELTQRLAEGKVYVPEQAARAVEHFFKPGNLTALRELALRRTAERVDAQMRTYMRAHAIPGPWAAGERLLVCVNELPGAAALVRSAKRLADGLHAPWVAVHVRTHRYQRLSEPERDRIADTLRLAERLGAQTLTMPGDRIATELLAYAKETNVTQILVGKSPRSRWFELMHGSVVRELVAKADGIAVHVVPGAGETVPAKRVRTGPRERRRDPRPYMVAGAMVAAALAFAYPLDRATGIENESLVFLAPVIVSAMRDGYAPSLFAALLSTLCYNFFFLSPFYTFTIANPANVLAFLFFGIVSVVTSTLAARARAQMVAARGQARTTAELYAFSRKLTGVADFSELLWATVHQIAAMLRAEAVILLPDPDGQLAVEAAWPPEDQLDEADLAAARWAWDHDQPAGRDAETLPGAKRLFLPMRTGRGKVAMLGIRRPAPGPLLTPDERRLLDALLDQTAIAIERVQLARRVDEDRVLTETERLRAALLASVSHDLKTPLASILGTIGSLRSYGALYDDATREEMLGTAQEEAERLGRFLDNVLDVTRLEGGAIGPRREPVDLADVVGSALRRAGRLLSGHRVTTDLPADLPFLLLDFHLTEQAVLNLLENAARHTPRGSGIAVIGRRTVDGVTLEVVDEGPGVPAEEAERIFDKFHRGRGGDTRGGTGLGLAVSRGFAEAMGGMVEARPRTDRTGSVFRLTFPVALAVEAMAEPADAAPA